MRLQLPGQLILIICFVCPFTIFADGDMRVTDLRCEYVKNPLGIDVTKPHLSWQIESTTQGEKQTAYQIVVSSSQEKLSNAIGDLWDSGKIESDQSQLVAYSGKPLLSKMECHWKVRVWDNEGKPSTWSHPARWTMGLLKPDDWSGKWISAPSPKPKKELVIRNATYRTEDGSVTVDVTEIMKKELARKKPFKVDFKTLGGDPAPGIVKELIIEYTKDGKPGTVRAKDFKTINLFEGESDSMSPTLQFRKDFKLEAAPSFAQITINSPAYFELYVNGEKIGSDVLSPAVSDLKKQTFSLTYDVSRHLKKGINCMGIWVGIGWADEIVVRAQLDAVVNGTTITIATDPSWNTRTSGRYRIGLRKWGNFGGELVDARKTLPDWCRPGLDSTVWDNAILVNPNLGPTRNQPCPANRIGKVIPAAVVTQIGNGRYEIDFGTALTGWFRMKMPKLEPGATVTMTFADMKSNNETKKLSRIGDSSWYQHFNQVSKFISSGKAGEVFENKFNYAGFRYVVIEGLESAPAKEDATAMLVDSDLEEAGAFGCSNDLLNRIHKLNQWTQRCLDLGGYYVDCPHRERMGYGDGQVAVEGFMTNFRADGYYRKWLSNWRDVQKQDGALPNTAPWGRGGGGPGWGGLLSAITWRHYLYYGDKRVLEENFDAVRSYVDYLEGISKNNGDILTGKTAKYRFIGDWVAPDRGMDTKNAPSHQAREIFNNCYRIYQIELLINMAKVLGRDDVAEKYQKIIERIRPIIHSRFYDAQKIEYVLDEQAYYVMPLMTGVTPEGARKEVFQKLEDCILNKRSGHLDTGMFGTYFMMEYLREIGRSDLVFTMFNQTDYPGWGYMLQEGATTLWEQWNGYWSRIHSCFTSPDNWLYQGLAGIQADPARPGFKNVIIKPDIVGDVKWVKSYHDSPYGRIVSNWRHENGKLTMEVSIPPNTTATIYVPAINAANELTVSGQIPKDADHVTFLRMEKGSAVLEVDSGNYMISSHHSGNDI